MMTAEKIRGLIIRENFSGEADKFITVFAKGTGKISVFCKGARNTKSRFLSSTALFTYGDFIIRTATKTPTLMSADVIDSFYALRTDYEKTVYASYFIEFIDKSFLENVADDNVLLLSIRTLKKMCSPGCNTKLTACIFLLKLMGYMGYQPNMEDSDVLSLGDAVKYAIAYVQNADIKDIFSFELEDKYIYELEKFLYGYIDYHTEIKLKSSKIIKNLY